MEIEKKLTVSAPRERVWALLLDPHVMTGAVPGMQSIDVISPTEYVAQMKVKVSFVSAKFKLHTRITEQREPEYLRAEGTGEDDSVASSLKQTSEIFLSGTPEGGTELRIKVNVDVLGRLGSFGLAAMKTKADRMWDEFGKNLAARLEGGPAEQAGSPRAEGGAAATSAAAAQGAAARQPQAPSLALDAPMSVMAASGGDKDGGASQAGGEPKGWFARLLGGQRASAGAASGHAGSVIRIEVRQMDKTVSVEWPVEAAGQCQAWLRELLARQG